MNELLDITQKIIAFRDARDWSQFHNLKDLAMALSIEAAELQELFLWKNPEQADPNKLEEELADVLMYALLIATKAQLNPIEIIEKKLALNEKKYPVEKAKGNAKKYTEL